MPQGIALAGRRVPVAFVPPDGPGRQQADRKEKRETKRLQARHADLHVV